MSNRSIVRRSISALLSPSFCAACWTLITRGNVVCDPCRCEIEPVQPSYESLSSGQQYRVYALGRYQGVLALLAQGKNERAPTKMYSLGLLMARYSIDAGLDPDVIIPVPLHWWRRVWRGYNQSAILAKAVQPHHPSSKVIEPFRRCRHTQSQQALTKELRAQNVQQAFARSWNYRSEEVRNVLEGKKVLIIDDVYTTGATVEALIELIVPYQPASIQVLVACRV